MYFGPGVISKGLAALKDGMPLVMTATLRGADAAEAEAEQAEDEEGVDMAVSAQMQ